MRRNTLLRRIFLGHVRLVRSPRKALPRLVLLASCFVFLLGRWRGRNTLLRRIFLLKDCMDRKIFYEREITEEKTHSIKGIRLYNQWLLFYHDLQRREKMYFFGNRRGGVSPPETDGLWKDYRKVD
jgi:hypothetical protein